MSGQAIPGMSGGPILDAITGQLIGIYGDFSKELDIPTTYLYGIPINTAKVLAKLAGINLPSPSGSPELDRLTIITPAYQGSENYISVSESKLDSGAFIDEYDGKLVSFVGNFVGVHGVSGYFQSVYEISENNRVFITLYNSSTMPVYIDKKYSEKIFQYNWGKVAIEGLAKKIRVPSSRVPKLSIEIHKIRYLGDSESATYSQKPSETTISTSPVLEQKISPEISEEEIVIADAYQGSSNYVETDYKQLFSPRLIKNYDGKLISFTAILVEAEITTHPAPA